MKVVLTQREDHTENYPEIRDALSHDWIIYMQNIGYVPIPIPNKLENLEGYLDLISPELIILTGGNTISPIRYGEFTENYNDVAESRDYTELSVIKYGIIHQIPILGVCRGMQMIQVFFGGKISKLNLNNQLHVNVFHEIEIIDPFFEIFINTRKMTVNSFHNQGIYMENLSNPLKPFAVSYKDQTVEGFYHSEYPIIGVMWHPERLSPSSDIDRNLIQMLKLRKWVS